MIKTRTDETIATLKQAALAATPQDIDSAERTENRPDGSYLTCPACEGEGCIPFESDYCNYDHIAIGVQFYGVGDGFGKAEAYFRAARPAIILALLDRLEHAEAALLATQQPEPREAVLYEHDDGRYAVASSAEVADFTRCEPAWRRLGPVTVYGSHAEPRPPITDDQRDKIERAEACLRNTGRTKDRDAANGLLDVLIEHPVMPEKRDAVARSKRILALVDEYHENPTRDTRTALRHALMDELQPEPRTEVTNKADASRAGDGPH